MRSFYPSPGLPYTFRNWQYLFGNNYYFLYLYFQEVDLLPGKPLKRGYLWGSCPPPSELPQQASPHNRPAFRGLHR
jgi:hypothetical protein